MKPKDVPAKAIRIDTYSDLSCIAKQWAAGKMKNIGVTGNPGLGKSRAFETAMKNIDHLFVNGKYPSLWSLRKTGGAYQRADHCR